LAQWWQEKVVKIEKVVQLPPLRQAAATLPAMTETAVRSSKKYG
jgi:hypothetical protein